MTSDGFLRLLKSFGIVLVKNRSLEAIRSLKMPLEGFWSPLSKGETSGFRYEMMAVAKKWGISTLIVSCNDVMFANDSGEFQDNGRS